MTQSNYLLQNTLLKTLKNIFKTESKETIGSSIIIS
jgi:hypothetical protein